MSNITGDSTINEAKKYLLEGWEEGVSCPCCTQHVQLYRRKITSSMAIGLIHIVNHHLITRATHFHIEKFFKDLDVPSSIRGDISKFRFWNFLKKTDTPGVYEITQEGINFVSGKMNTPKYVYLFNNEMYRFSEEKVTINEALTDRFSLKELLRFNPDTLYKKKQPVMQAKLEF